MPVLDSQPATVRDSGPPGHHFLSHEIDTFDPRHGRHVRSHGSQIDLQRLTQKAGHNLCRCTAAHRQLAATVQESPDYSLVVAAVCRGTGKDCGSEPSPTLYDNDADIVARSPGVEVAHRLSELFCQILGRELGMDPDEILRLAQITGLAEAFKDEEFSEAWEAEGQEK